MKEIKNGLYSVELTDLKLKSGHERRETVRFRCPLCGSKSGHEHRYDGSFNRKLGVGQCFSCGARFVKGSGEDYGGNTPNKPNKPYGANTPNTPNKPYKPYKANEPNEAFPLSLTLFLHRRGISEATAQRLGVGWRRMKNAQGVEEDFLAFPFYEKGQVVNVQYRSVGKEFRMEAGCRLLPWNVDAALSEDTVYLTEGMMDALALAECGLEGVVSLPNGCGTRMDTFKPYLKTHFAGRRIVYCGDMDERGLKMRADVAEYFKDSDFWVVDWQDGKDADDVLMSGGKEAVVRCVGAMRRLPLAHVATVDSAMNELEQLMSEGVPRPPGINLYGFSHLVRFETGRLMVISGYPGAGKSSFADFVMMSLCVEQGWKAAVYSPEKYPLELHYFELGQVLMGREMTRKNFQDADLHRGTDWLRQHVFHITDESSQIEDILATAAQLVSREGIRLLLLDPFNYIDLPVISGANDTQKISHVLRSIVEFAHTYDVLVMLVAHPKKPQEVRRKGEVDMPSLYDIAGSADFYNKCDYGLIVQRNNALTFVHVLKVRFRHLGQLGVRAFQYSAESGRFTGTHEERSPSTGAVIAYTALAPDRSDWSGDFG